MLAGDLLQIAATVAGAATAVLALVLTSLEMVLSSYSAMTRSRRAKRGEAFATVARNLGQNAIVSGAALGLALLAIVSGEALLLAAALGTLALSGLWMAYTVILQAFAAADSALAYSAISQVARQGSDEARAQATRYLAETDDELGPVAEMEAKAIRSDRKTKR
jgi:hypothetical protein